ncbi:MAG: hypothetical protein IPL52_00085 [Flavobacteriales bacterium]|nr:hypothetical protein [Flavobacteriales bacterium]
MGARSERIVFIATAGMVFLLVLLRALLVPLVHDEATSFIAYAQGGRFLPFASLWDANNHYLNSLLGFIGFKLFGLKLLALRYGSVLSYLLFAWSAWRLGHLVQHRTVRWVLWSALLLCPFLLDFFSFFRGYGPAMAFLLFSVQALLRFAQWHRRGDLLAVLLGMAVANGFLLALVPLWAVILVVLTVLVSRSAVVCSWLLRWAGSRSRELQRSHCCFPNWDFFIMEERAISWASQWAHWLGVSLDRMCQVFVPRCSCS